MSAERLSFIQARLDEAMPGPWEFDGLTVSQAADNYAEVIPTDVNCSSYCYGGSVRGPGKSDAEFIANAPTDIAFLLDLARKQQAALDAARKACDRIITNADGHKPPGPPHPTREQATAMRIRQALEAKP